MTLFNESGGRLLRIAFMFGGVCLLVILIMSVFTYHAMGIVKDISLTDDPPQGAIMFYTQIINNMNLGTVLGALSGVLIAVAARYGLRETSKNISEGMKNHKDSVGPEGGN